VPISKLDLMRCDSDSVRTYHCRRYGADFVLSQTGSSFGKAAKVACTIG